MIPLQFHVRTERVEGVPKKKFEGNPRDHYYVRMFIEGQTPSALDNVKYVIYELHPTFRNPKRISEDRHNNFELKIWTWGFFNVNCQVFLKSGDMIGIKGNVKYDVD